VSEGAFERVIKIERTDPEQRIVWGWAYVCEEGGEQVVDHSGEFVDDPLEIQKAAHRFVLDSCEGGMLHEGAAGYIVDSMFFSKDLQQALGIDLGKVGWFIGMHVTDDEAWAGVRAGKYGCFSIAGRSQKDEVIDAEAA
jgi:hypothetical protein